MGFLSAAENVHVIDGTAATEDLLFDKLLPKSYTANLTRYAFDLNGRKYAQFMRDQMEAQLRQQGELPAGLRLDLVREYVTMQGSGEIWLDAAGLPVRQIIHLTFPAQPGASQWLEAKITTGFNDRQTGASPLATVLGLPGRLLSDPASLLPSPIVLRRTVFLAGLLLLLAGVAVLCITHRRSRYFYTAISTAMLFSMVLGPLFQAHEVSAFSEHQAAQLAESQQQQDGQQAGAALNADLRGDGFNPQVNPLAESGSDVQEVAMAQRQDLAMSSVAAPAYAPRAMQLATTQLTTVNAQLAASPCMINSEVDSDCDGLTDRIETTKLGTDPYKVDTDGDSISDGVEVQGFNDGQQWYLDPLNADSNGDSILDNMECPELVDVKADGTIDSAFVPGVCRNSDSDTTPDVFDFDNDGDGVPDSIDSAPFNMAGDPTTGLADNHFDFNLTLTGDDKPVFATFEVRPTNPDHLWYTDNVLDWPSNDTQGQIMRVHDNTFADLSGYAYSGKLTNGDILLTPLLGVQNYL